MVFGEMCVLMLSASSLGQPRPEDPPSYDFRCLPAGHRPRRARPAAHRPQRHHAWLWSSTARSAFEQLLQVLILLKLFLWIDLASVIQNRDMTFNLELDNNFVIGTDENRFAIGRPDEAIALIYTPILPTESTAGV